MGGYDVEERLDWCKWVTPRLLREKPVHRWYVFPHSFTSELVHGLMDDWDLGPSDVVLDPFAGAGTTLLAAKERGLSASGYDLSPLAVLVAGAKVADYEISELERGWDELEDTIDPGGWTRTTARYPGLISKALPGHLLGAFEDIDRSISRIGVSMPARRFFRVALLGLIPQFSRSVASGGWLRWVRNKRRSTSLLRTLRARVSMMIDDVRRTDLCRRGVWEVVKADARSVPCSDNQYTAVITSPPYPNRHDYTRVFGVELMFAFLNWEDTRALRYQSFHSHPEARPRRQWFDEYMPPQHLTEVVAKIRAKIRDGRVARMIEGYFVDTFLSLREVKRSCRANARVAWVVGNAQYSGVTIAVDELTAAIGEQAGLRCERLLVARYRGNSAQQMGQYGRNPSRESVVVFRT